jgi:hypothetical protein
MHADVAVPRHGGGALKMRHADVLANRVAHVRVGADRRLGREPLGHLVVLEIEHVRRRRHDLGNFVRRSLGRDIAVALMVVHVRDLHVRSIFAGHFLNNRRTFGRRIFHGAVNAVGRFRHLGFDREKRRHRLRIDAHVVAAAWAMLRRRLVAVHVQERKARQAIRAFIGASNGHHRNLHAARRIARFSSTR